MQTSLPIKSRQHQRIIDDICQTILAKHQDKIAFIILFGSFARGDWVYDTYMEDHITYEYASDYDFLILAKKAKHSSLSIQEIRIATKTVATHCFGVMFCPPSPQ
jgi:predicted nucleotidyltransferase